MDSINDIGKETFFHWNGLPNWMPTYMIYCYFVDVNVDTHTNPMSEYSFNTDNMSMDKRLPISISNYGLFLLFYYSDMEF